jgi:hypothetical protein
VHAHRHLPGPFGLSQRRPGGLDRFRPAPRNRGAEASPR